MKLILEEKESETVFHMIDTEGVKPEMLEQLRQFSQSRGGFFREDLKLFSVRKKWTKKTAQQIFELLEISVTFVDYSDSRDQTSIADENTSLVKQELVSYKKQTVEVIGFGKHKGTRWSELPLHYVQWLHNNLPANHHDMKHIKEVIGSLK